MARGPAKISLGLDITPFRKELDKVRSDIKNLGKADLGKDLNRSFKDNYLTTLKEQVKTYEEMIKSSEAGLNRLAAASERGFDDKNVKQYVETVAKLKDLLRETAKEAAQLEIGKPGSGSFPGMRAQASEGGGISIPPMMKRLLGPALGIFAAQRMARAGYNRVLENADPVLQLQALTGGQDIGADSSLGFSHLERRRRAVGISRQAGRDMTGDELGRASNLSEILERGFGVEQGAFTQAFGAARRAGIQDPSQFIEQAAGGATMAGMTGSAIEEYLSQMTGYLESVSKGVNIDDASLQGFAQSLGKLEFFQQDPARIFEALRGMEGAFKDQDPYQNFLSIRALSAASGGNLSMAGIEARRDLGLFGGSVDEKTRRQFTEGGMGGALDIFNVSGENMLNERARMSFRDIQGMPDQQARLYHFAESMGLNVNQAAPLLGDILEQVKQGKQIGEIEVSKFRIEGLKEAMKSNEERARENMETFHGSVIRFDRAVDDFKDAAAEKTGKTLIGDTEMDTKGQNEFFKSREREVTKKLRERGILGPNEEMSAADKRLFYDSLQENKKKAIESGAYSTEVDIPTVRGRTQGISHKVKRFDEEKFRNDLPMDDIIRDFETKKLNEVPTGAGRYVIPEQASNKIKDFNISEPVPINAKDMIDTSRLENSLARVGDSFDPNNRALRDLTAAINKLAKSRRIREIMMSEPGTMYG
jgi:hypothetical protein